MLLIGGLLGFSGLNVKYYLEDINIDYTQDVFNRYVFEILV